MFRANYLSCMSQGMFALSVAPGNTFHMVLFTCFYIWYCLKVHSSFDMLNGAACMYQQIEYIPNSELSEYNLYLLMDDWGRRLISCTVYSCMAI